MRTMSSPEVEAATMTTGDWISAALDAAQTLAIFVGAAWAYFKFVRGRTFHRRAELSVDATLLKSAAAAALRVRTTFVNTGAADIPLRLKRVTASVFEGEIDAKGRSVWRDVAKSPVFAAHEWLESEETIADDVLIPLPEPDRPVLAYGVTCFAIERRGRRWGGLRPPRPGGVQWTANAIVAIELKPSARSTANDETKEDDRQ
jgi:hypothetical protein